MPKSLVVHRRRGIILSLIGVLVVLKTILIEWNFETLITATWEAIGIRATNAFTESNTHSDLRTNDTATNLNWTTTAEEGGYSLERQQNLFKSAKEIRRINTFMILFNVDSPVDENVAAFLLENHNLTIVRLVNNPESFELYFVPDLFPYRYLFSSSHRTSQNLFRHHGEIIEPFRTLPDNFQLFLYKRTFSEFLVRMGFQTYVPLIYSSPREVVAKNGLPVVLKVSDGSGSRGVYYVETVYELMRLAKRFEGRRQDYIIQQYIANTDQQSISFSALRGRVLRLFCHQRSLPPGQKILRWTDGVKDADLPEIDVSRCHRNTLVKVIESMNYTGIGHFDVRLSSATNIPYILECNPHLPGLVARNAGLLGDFLCSLQFDGEGKLGRDGCEGGASHLVQY